MVDILIDRSHPDFQNWGLNYPGLIRTTFLTTTPENKIQGTIGNIGEKTLHSLINNLTDYLKR